MRKHELFAYQLLHYDACVVARGSPEVELVAPCVLQLLSISNETKIFMTAIGCLLQSKYGDICTCMAQQCKHTHIHTPAGHSCTVYACGANPFDYPCAFTNEAAKSARFTFAIKLSNKYAWQ